jgi:acyl-CoA synthetase (AMP-forming)/AMP-acid ligase II
MSRTLAQHLCCHKGVARGDTVMLVFLPSLDFIVAFLACLRAGVIAVPVSAAWQCCGRATSHVLIGLPRNGRGQVYPPDPRNLGKSMVAFSGIQQSCGAKIVLSNRYPHPQHLRCCVPACCLLPALAREQSAGEGPLCRCLRVCPLMSASSVLDSLPSRDCASSLSLSLSTQYSNLTSLSNLKTLFTGSRVSWPELQWLYTDDLVTREPQPAITLPTLDSSAVAFLQFTSGAVPLLPSRRRRGGHFSRAMAWCVPGSTALPKGVMITHANLMHNLSTIVHALEAGTSTQVVSWLPQYHDMGLIGSYLGVLFCGGSGVYMSPISFVKNPPMWVEVSGCRDAPTRRASVPSRPRAARRRCVTRCCCVNAVCCARCRRPSPSTAARTFSRPTSASSCVRASSWRRARKAA